MNNWIGTIRLTKDPEVRYNGDSKAFARFDGACNRTYKADGQPDADFFSFVAFGKTAETIEKYVKKGMKLLINAEVRNNNYEKEGVKHYGQQWIVNSFEFCESKSSNPAPASGDDGFVTIPDGVMADELPF